MLKVDGAALNDALTIAVTITRGETIKRPYNLAQALGMLRLILLRSHHPWCLTC